MKEWVLGCYATQLCLPASSLSRAWRGLSRRLRGKAGGFFQPTRLPVVSWKRYTTRRFPRIWESEKENGNVRVTELAVLAALAADCENGTTLFEIGTFDGRTTLNLALNSPPGCRVYTLGLAPGVGTARELVDDERHLAGRKMPGSRFEKYRHSAPGVVGKIRQLIGDSWDWDFSPHARACSLVFVDGSHAYDYVVSDTRAAMKLAKPGGVVIWHDYGIWPDVTAVLEDLERRELHGLRHISGTSLVIWKKLQAVGRP